MIPSNLLPSQLVAKWLPALAHGFEPAPGALVTPRLRLIRRVGDERPGSIWVADHLALATPVEVTFAEVEPSAAPEAQAGALALRAQSHQAQTEATALVNEPHLVSIIEHGDVRGLPFIVTELLEGKSMRQRLLHGPAKLAEVQTIVQQASGALAKAHALGVSHGRLRPDYLYLTELAQKPFLKLAGFGELADVADAANQHAYASPEQLMIGGVDARSDLWSFAVSLYELLTTTLPFEAPTPAGVSVAICNADFARPTHYRADLPPAVDAWFAAALAKDPQQRFADAAELARAFIAALANEAPSISSPSVSAAPVPANALGAGHVAPASASLPPAMPSNAPPPLPLPSFPPPSSRASVSSLASPVGEPAPNGAPEELALELADGDDDEKTVQWEGQEGATGTAAPTPPVLPNPLPPVALPSLATRLPILPLPAPLSPAALSSVALPSMSSQRASAGPLGAPPNLEPSRYLDSPYMASVASALAVPVYPAASSEPPPARPARWWQFTADKTWLAAIAFAAGVALTWFVYEPDADDASGAAVAQSESEPSVIRTLSVDDLPRAPGEEAELPKIVRTNQLPRAEDEAVMANAAPVGAASVEHRAAPVQRVQALSPAPVPARAAPARAKPAPSRDTAPRATAPRATASLSTGPRAADSRERAAAASNGKPEARANCSPPYYFDDKGIQRLKAECLNGTGVIAGPYGAVVPVRATGKAAPAPAPAASKSTASARAPAPAGNGKAAASNCNPPYYFEGNIRRIKIECL